jgi:hypothetical protein
VNVKHILEETTRKHLELITDNRTSSKDIPADLLATIQRKKDMLKAREAEIVKCDAHVAVVRELTIGQRKEADYVLHLQYLIKQRQLLYVEEERMERRLTLDRGRVASNVFIHAADAQEPPEVLEREVTKDKSPWIPYQYNRLEAVKYAEAWWNGRNPAYRNFQDNCTNFISQCLHAGESPMSGYPNVRGGWWQQNGKWSWSWAVAHSFHWYLSGTPVGLRAKQAEKPEELLLGDVIAYDFENDGRWNHTTIVTGRDADGMPLVNAHSADSRHRYWSYEDSSKYTPQMKYKFFHILNNA